MTRIALGQSPEDMYTGNEGWFEPIVVPAGSVAPSAGGGGSIFSDLWATVTQPNVVNATLNKYLFGSNLPISTAPTAAPVTTGQIIAGVPNVYLFIGGAAALLLLMKPKRGRR